jgi:hypothetical protein
MPYSDNLYSVYDDSDSDGNEDALSPTDGYFTSSSSVPSNVVPRVPNVMVVDPTLQQSETSAESKAREAGQERLLNSPNSPTSHVEPQAPSTRDSSSYTPSTSPSTRSYSTQPTHTSSTAYAPSSYTATTSTSASRQPLRTRARTASVYSDAPPAYTPSPTAPTPTSPTAPTFPTPASPTPATPLSPTSQANQARTYNTFPPIMGIENERLLGREPESMGHPDDEEAARTPFSNRRIRRRLPPWLSWRMLILAAVLLIVSVGFLASSYKLFKGDEEVSSTLRFIPRHIFY